MKFGEEFYIPPSLKQSYIKSQDESGRNQNLQTGMSNKSFVSQPVTSSASAVSRQNSGTFKQTITRQVSTISKRQNGTASGSLTPGDMLQKKNFTPRNKTNSNGQAMLAATAISAKRSRKITIIKQSTGEKKGTTYTLDGSRKNGSKAFNDRSNREYDDDLDGSPFSPSTYLTQNKTLDSKDLKQKIYSDEDE